LSYSARGGHGYGNQRRGSSFGYPGKSKRQSLHSNNTINELDHERPAISTAFSPGIIVKVPATFTQPSIVGTLPHMEIPKQAFQIAQLLSNRNQLELQLIDPTNQNIFRFKVSKQEDLDPEMTEQPPDNNIILANQSYSSFEYVNGLRAELSKFGLTLIAEG
jgi:hypothetical protein